MNKIAIIYSPFGKLVDAQQVLKTLIEQKLVACGNIVRGDSGYIWKGEYTAESEYILLCKTTISKSDEAALAMGKHHPYDVPAILQWEVTCNQAYGEWVKHETDE